MNREISPYGMAVGHGLSDGRAGRLLSRWLGRLVLWAGIGVLVLLAIPAGVLFFMICKLWSALDWFTARLHGRGDV